MVTRNLLGTQTRSAAIAALLLAVPFAAMWALHDLGANVVSFIAFAMAAGAVYLVALFALHHSAEKRAAFWLIIAGAIVFRTLLLPSPPELSEDLNRYRWEGRVQLHGWNPYAIAPNDPRLTYLRENDFWRVPAQEVGVIYPPLMELVFRESTRLLYAVSPNPNVLWHKFPFVLGDLAILALLAGQVRAGRIRNYQLAMYAWNPLVIVEIAGSGHMDSLAMLAMLGAVLLLERQRSVLSTTLLSAAAVLKVWPLVFVPLWLRHLNFLRDRKAWLAVAPALALPALVWWPFRGGEGFLIESLAFTEKHFRFNNSGLYMLLRSIHNTHEFAAGIAMGVVAALALWAAARKLEPVRAIPIVLAAVLLFAQNSFSWYFLWPLPFLALRPMTRFTLAWLTLTVTQFLSYEVVIRYYALREWRFLPFFLFLTYAPFFVVLFWPKFALRAPATASSPAPVSATPAQAD